MFNNKNARRRNPVPTELKKIVEALLLVSDAPLGVARIQSLFTDAAPSADEIKKTIEALQAECDGRGVELRKIGNAYRYQSRAEHADWIRKLHETRPPRLSRALLETLAIIAHRQPVTRGDIENIRGVGVTTEIMRRLIERGWIKEAGVRDIPGHPALFATTPEFLSYFGLESLNDLPALPEQRDLGEIAGEMDTPLPPELLASLTADDGDAADTDNLAGDDADLADGDDDTTDADTADDATDDGVTDTDDTTDDDTAADRDAAA